MRSNGLALMGNSCGLLLRLSLVGDNFEAGKCGMADILPGHSS